MYQSWLGCQGSCKLLCVCIHCSLSFIRAHCWPADGAWGTGGVQPAPLRDSHRAIASSDGDVEIGLLMMFSFLTLSSFLTHVIAAAVDGPARIPDLLTLSIISSHLVLLVCPLQHLHAGRIYNHTIWCHRRGCSPFYFWFLFRFIPHAISGGFPHHCRLLFAHFRSKSTS